MTYERFQKAVGEMIKRARKAKGLTQEDMVEFKFNVRHYQDIEAGKVPFTIETLYRISKALKVTPASLIDIEK